MTVTIDNDSGYREHRNLRQRPRPSPMTADTVSAATITDDRDSF
jgi:hypothetical protein